MPKILIILFPIAFIYFEMSFASSFFEDIGITIRDFFSIVESCNSKWILANMTALEEDLRNRVFGQPFILSALLPILKHHFKQKNTKALALSFHGSPGTGKNFVTELIAKNLYRKGVDSRYFHFFSGISDFPRSADTSYYKELIINKIETSVKLCEWSLFVFDEIDKVPEGILDVIKSYIDVGKRKDQAEFRNAIYIFLSNVGESHIIDENLAQWKNRIPRKNFYLKEFQDILYAATFNEKGGLKYSTVVRSGLINLYLPFLPLEKNHIEKCIISELKRQNHSVDNDVIKNVITELDFGPPPENIFASHGCKQIETKVVLQLAKRNKNYFTFSDEL